MSEIVQSSGSESGSSSSGGAVDTASIAASVMAEMDGGGDGDNTSTENTSADTSDASVAGGDTTQQVESKPQADPDDFDAVEKEVVDALGRKRENRIPHSRVSKMIEKAIAKKRGEWETADLTPVKAEVEKYQTRMKEVEGIEAIMASDPGRFVQMLASVNPAYAKFAAVLNSGGTVAQAQAAAQKVDDNNDPEPEPDYDMGDGRKTYSLDGLKKLREWDRRQAAKLAAEQVGERLKPIEEERKAAAERERKAKFDAELQGRLTKKLERAKKWPNFEENATEILATWRDSKDPEFDLHDAYLQVVMPKVAADRTKMREAIIAELNALPKTTSAATTAAATKPEGGPKDTAAIAREVMRELGA